MNGDSDLMNVRFGALCGLMSDMEVSEADIPTFDRLVGVHDARRRLQIDLRRGLKPRLVSVAKRKIALRHGRFYGCSYVVFCLTCTCAL